MLHLISNFQNAGKRFTQIVTNVLTLGVSEVEHVCALSGHILGNQQKPFFLLWTWKCLTRIELVTFDSITSNLLTLKLGKFSQEKYTNFLVSPAS